MTTIEINQWIQDDLVSFAKENMLEKWLDDKGITDSKERMNYSIGMESVQYGCFEFDIYSEYEQIDSVNIIIRDALKMYLSDAE